MLTAGRYSEPLVGADNIRLCDVALWLLSRQLSVKQVMLKGAVIQLTRKLRRYAAKDPACFQKTICCPNLAEDKGWSFDIAPFASDSVLVFQHEDDEQVTVRDIRLEMERDSQRAGRV